MSDASPTICLTLELSEQEADHLRTNTAAYFIDQQPDRFAGIDRADTDQLVDERWRNGHMSWCETASDAMLLRAYERATGADAILVWDDVDLFGGCNGSWVVLSSRPYQRPLHV